MCDQFECSSVIQGHHIYKDIFMPMPPLKAKENLIMIMIASITVAIIQNNTIIEPPY